VSNFKHFKDALSSLRSFKSYSDTEVTLLVLLMQGLKEVDTIETNQCAIAFTRSFFMNLIFTTDAKATQITAFQRESLIASLASSFSSRESMGRDEDQYGSQSMVVFEGAGKRSRDEDGEEEKGIGPRGIRSLITIHSVP